MKGFRLFGEYVFEYIIITLLLILSLVLVIPFIPVFIGAISYFTHKRDDRMLKDLFVTIKENIGIIIRFTIFELIVLIVSFLNIYYFQSHAEGMNRLILIISYIFLIFGIIFLAHAPMIIISMKVNLRQLIFNTFLFFFGGFFNSVIAIASIMAVIIIASFVPYLIFPSIYFVALMVEIFTRKNILKLKAKSMNISVRELKEKDEEDEFFKDLEQ